MIRICECVCPSVPHLLTGDMVKIGQDRTNLEGMILLEYLIESCLMFKPLFNIIAEIRPTCCRNSPGSINNYFSCLHFEVNLLKIMLTCVDIHALLSNHDPTTTLDRNITLLKF